MPARPAESGAAVSLWLGGLDGPPSAEQKSEVPYYAASTMKLPLAVAAHRLHERGAIDLDEPVPVHDDLASAVAGARVVLRPEEDQESLTWGQRGSCVSLRTLLARTVSASGNLASSLILEHVGAAAVADVLVAAGCSRRSRIQRSVGDEAARVAGLDNVLTAHDLARVLAALAAGRLIGPAGTAGLLADLGAQVHRAGIAAGLPHGLEVASKSGWVGGLTHDAALVRPVGHPPVVLVVLTAHHLDQAGGEALVARTAARAWAGLERRAGRALRGAP